MSYGALESSFEADFGGFEVWSWPAWVQSRPGRLVCPLSLILSSTRELTCLVFFFFCFLIFFYVKLVSEFGFNREY
jgi:hypothetical protein